MITELDSVVKHCFRVFPRRQFQIATAGLEPGIPRFLLERSANLSLRFLKNLLTETSPQIGRQTSKRTERAFFPRDCVRCHRWDNRVREFENCKLEILSAARKVAGHRETGITYVCVTSHRVYRAIIPPVAEQISLVQTSRQSFHQPWECRARYFETSEIA